MDFSAFICLYEHVNTTISLISYGPGGTLGAHTRRSQPHPLSKQAGKMAASFIRDHPELRPFLLHNARPTGVVIGDGSYGSVLEVEMPGAKCAAKKIHDFFLDPTRMPREGMERHRASSSASVN